MSNPKSWRDVYKVHPAAELFPMLPEAQLRKLGEDIKANGLQESIIFWSPGSEQDKTRPKYLLDGRNRLAAIELITGKVPFNKEGYFVPEGIPGWSDRHLFELDRSWNSINKEFELVPGTDPYAYVISKNIHRRHLTKEQQADLIVKVMKSKETDLAKVAKSVPRDSSGHLKGSTKNLFKEKVVEEAKKHGISKRTAEKAIAKDKGPTQPKREAVSSPKPARGAKVVDSDNVSRKVISFLKKELKDASTKDKHIVMIMIADAFDMACVTKSYQEIFKVFQSFLETIPGTARADFLATDWAA